MLKKTILFLTVISIITLLSCNDNNNPVNVTNNLSENSNTFQKHSDGNTIPGQFIVVFKDDIQFSRVPEVANEMAKIHTADILHLYKNSIRGFSAKFPPGILKKLKDDPRVKYIEEDKIVSLAPPPGKGKPPKDDPEPDPEPVDDEVIPWGITRVSGGQTYTGSNVAWVIDSGIDLDHPDLNVDVSNSKTFVRSKSADDDNGHGTHVAGTIAAIDNTFDVVGVAAGATVVAVKVLDRRGSGTASGVIAGIDYVAAKGKSGDVANMSLGGGAYTPIDDAVLSASQNGIRFSLSAGNEDRDANLNSPARVNGTNIYTVSATDINDNFASFSNYGNPPVDYAAPGVNILSLYKNGGMATMSGTSMAAPHVAGILLWGPVKTSGYANGDPDGNPDPIASK